MFGSLLYPLYSLDMTPNDFQLLANILPEFHQQEDIIGESESYFEAKHKSFYMDGTKSETSCETEEKSYLKKWHKKQEVPMTTMWKIKIKFCTLKSRRIQKI